MRPTEKTWCDVCKQMTYGCRHPENDAAAAAAVFVDDDEIAGDVIRTLSGVRRQRRKRTTFVTFEGLVSAGAIVMLPASPQLVFRPLRLVVGPGCAPWFKLIDIRIGHCSQWVHHSSNGCDCRIFPPDPSDVAPLNNLEGIDTVQVGQYFTLAVRNADQGQAHTFDALVWGEAIY